MTKICNYRIVLAQKPTYNERRAAAFIRRGVRLITGATLEIVSDAEKPLPLEIVIGKTLCLLYVHPLHLRVGSCRKGQACN